MQQLITGLVQYQAKQNELLTMVEGLKKTVLEQTVTIESFMRVIAEHEVTIQRLTGELQAQLANLSEREAAARKSIYELQVDADTAKSAKTKLSKDDAQAILERALRPS